MPSFKDASGKEWLVNIDAPTCLKIRAECDPDFLLEKDGKEGTYDRLQRDSVVLCRVIFLICERQRLADKVSEETFYLSVVGDAIDGATEALLQAMLLFTPRRSREMARAIAEKTDRMAELARAKVLSRMNDPETEAQILAALDETLDQAMRKIMTRLSSATNTPVSAE